MIIRDGRGRGHLMGVNSDQQAESASTTETLYAYINRVKQQAYMCYLDITPAGAGNTFGYFKNTSAKNLIVVEMRIWTSAAEAIDIYFNRVGTPTGGTTITPVNTNLGPREVAEGTFLKGVNIGGLSSGAFFDRLRFPGDDEDHKAFWPGQIIMPTGANFILQALNGAISTEVSISFFYQTAE